MYEEQDFVAISRTIDVYDLLDNDSFKKIDELVNEGRVIKYPKKDLKPEYLDILKNDKNILSAFIGDWKKYLYPNGYSEESKFQLATDLKLNKLIALLKKEAPLQKSLFSLLKQAKQQIILK
jgi:hypothetical protein